MLTGMPLERTVRRYTAYFRGWCQTFGEHDLVASQDEGIKWLFGEKQIGFILSSELTRSLYREVLGKQRSSPLLEISAERVRVGRFRQVLPEIWREQGLTVLTQLLQAEHDLHLYLTYHLVYPSGTRIVTLSQRKPLPIIYKEIRPMDIRLVRGVGDK
jgi:hypothetical protein